MTGRGAGSRTGAAGAPLHVCHLYDGHERVHGGRGSVPNVVWNVARETAATGHEVTVVERRWRGLDRVADHDGVHFERLDLRTGSDEPWAQVPYELVASPVGIARLVVDRTNFALSALRRLRQVDFDVLHVHLPFAASVLVTVAPWIRSRTVYTAHLGELRMNALTEEQRRGAGPEAGRQGSSARPRSEADPSAADGGAATVEDALAAPRLLSVVSPDTYLANRVAHSTVLNPSIEAAFVERGVSPDRLSVVPNGVDYERFSDVPAARVEAVRRSYGLAGATVVLFVGTVMPRKGVDDLVRAAATLVERGRDDLQVVVAGEDELDGDYARSIRDLAGDLGIGDRVTCTGFVPDEDLPALYAGADVFALPSREEGFGMTVTEALAAGTPVVATDVGGISRLLSDGEYGDVVAPNDPAAFATAVGRVLSDSDASSVADAARARAREFSWEAVAERFVAIYGSVATV